MIEPGRKTPVKRFRLNDKISATANANRDPIVREVRKVLEAFERSEVTGSRYVWKYLPDDAFTVICKPGMSVRTMNRTLLSHLIRIIEAFQMVSLWRSRDLVGSCVASLNEERLVSAATLTRSLIELAVTYRDAGDFLTWAFKSFPWSEIGDALVAPLVTDEHGKEISLEIFIERLMRGTRLNEHLAKTPNMRQTNIMTIIEKIDKRYGCQVMSHYELLCELAHPSTVGFQRYVSSITTLSNGWESRLMEEESFSERSVHISFECLWALSFSADSMLNTFGVFDELKHEVLKNIGRALPH
jgi:hypothetical protein